MPILALALALGCRASAEQGAATPEGAAATGPGVALAVEPGRAAPGEEVELVLRNGSDGAVGYNLCTSVLEREAESGWEAVPSDRVCTMELRMLEPGQDARFRLELPPDLAPGTYRFLTRVERMETGARDGVASDPFSVE
jgi:hypothetical protein